MPRAKRTLAEADANAETVPAAKRPSTGDSKAGGKENGTSKPPKASKQKKKKDSRVPKNADGNTWICICRPHDNDDDEDEDDDVETGNNAAAAAASNKTVCDGGQGPRCMCRRPADLHPSYDWVMTKRGFELALHWMHEREKRCQDNFDLYVFNDFNGYGTQEVMENMLLAFDEAMSPAAAAAAAAGEKPLDLMWRLWAQVEGMALFLNDDLVEYNMIDDSASVARFAEIIGTAVLSTIDLLIARGWFAPTSSAIRNTGLMLGRFIEFAQSQDDASGMNENGWLHRIVKLADEHGVAIEGKPDDEKVLQSIRADIEDADEEPPSKAEAARYARAKKKWTPKGDRDDEGSRVWGSWDWTVEFKAFRRERGVKVSPHGPVQGQMVSPFVDFADAPSPF